MKNINLKYFALLREKAGKSEEMYQTHAQNYQELYQELNEKYDFKLPLEMVQVAVNDEFVPLKTPLTSGHQVVFIPPVAGG